MADDPLKLDALVPLEAPAGLWTSIAEGLDAEETAPVERKSRPHRAWWGGGIAASAALVLSLGYLPTPVETNPPAVADNDRLSRIQAVSAAMEGRLDGWRDGVVDAAQADVLARMERELAWLDADIEADPDNATLWAERVVLQSEIMEQYLSSDWRGEMMVTAY